MEDPKEIAEKYLKKYDAIWNALDEKVRKDLEEQISQSAEVIRKSIEQLPSDLSNEDFLDEVYFRIEYWNDILEVVDDIFEGKDPEEAKKEIFKSMENFLTDTR